MNAPDVLEAAEGSQGSVLRMEFPGILCWTDLCTGIRGSFFPVAQKFRIRKRNLRI